jgi:predicted PurR-regulated permease PerM
VLPALVEQIGTLSERVPALREQLLSQYPPASFMHQSVERLLGGSGWADLDAWFGRLVTAGGIAFTGLTQLILMLMIALYSVIEGSRTYRWLLAFFTPVTRRKIHHTSSEVSTVIFHYVVGQVITSGLIMIYAFVVLSLLHVPAALTLAILAGIFDILPILGFLLLTAPAILLALSVSPRTALLVLLFYTAYAALESYLIVPKIYGKSLRLSTSSVLLGLLAGTLLAGIPGALAALPVVASYSVIERIWLKNYLAEGVAEKHEIQQEKEFGEKPT